MILIGYSEKALVIFKLHLELFVVRVCYISMSHETLTCLIIHFFFSCLSFAAICTFWCPIINNQTNENVIATDLNFSFWRFKASQAQSSYTRRHANVRLLMYLSYLIPAIFHVGV